MTAERDDALAEAINIVTDVRGDVDDEQAARLSDALQLLHTIQAFDQCTGDVREPLRAALDESTG